MTLEQLLELGLSEEIAKKVIEVHQAAIKDNYVPLARFNEVNEEKKQYKSQVDNLNKELGKLQKQLEDNQDAAQTIEQLKQQIKDKEIEMEKVRRQNAIKFEVLKADVYDVEDILPHLKEESIVLNDVEDILPHLKEESIVLNDDGTITGLKEQLDALKESKPYLFKQVEPTGTGGSLGGGPKNKQEPNDTSSVGKFISAIREVQAKRE